MSEEGTFIVATDHTPNDFGGGHPFFWENGVMWSLGVLPGVCGGVPGASPFQPTGVSADGSVISGYFCEADCCVTRACRWTRTGGPQALAHLSEDVCFGSSALCVSFDGSVIGGWGDGNPPCENRAARWAPGVSSAGVVLAGADSASVSAMNFDGSVMVGVCIGPAFVRRAFRWSAGGGAADLGVLPGMPGAGALAVSGDGSAVFGNSGTRLFRWTASEGMVDIGSGGAVQASVNWAGTRAVFTIGNPGLTTRAFIWTAQAGLMPLEDFASPRCVNLSGWSLATAGAISPGGGTFVGTGVLNGQSRVYRLSLPDSCFVAIPPCPADFNGQNGVTVQDIYDYLSAWNSGSASADFNGQNGVTVQDIYDFLAAWNAGCP